MANQTEYRVKTRRREAVMLTNRVLFSAGGNSVTSQESNRVAGFQISRTGAGLYTATLADKYRRVLDCSVGLIMGTFALATGSQLILLTDNSSTTRLVTLSLRNISAAAAADVEANATIVFRLLMGNVE
jgi:hypothetical protein